jgi:hypothetical protein
MQEEILETEVVPRIQQLVFMRKVDRAVARGFICSPPFQQGFNVGTDESFIIVDIDLTGFDQSSIEDVKTIQLILEPLQALYPNTTEVVADEEGNESNRVVYGYFEELGNNSADTPMITIADLKWVGK